MSIFEQAQTNFENLLLYLEDAQYEFWPVELVDDYGVATSVVIYPSEKIVNVILAMSETNEVFYIESLFDINIEKKDVPRISTALAIINDSIHYGKFQLDIESLEISYYLMHYYGSNVLTNDQYEMLLNEALTLISDFYEQINLFNRNELTIRELIVFAKENIRW